MKFHSIFKAKEAKAPFQWPSCKHPKTLSFRAGDNMFKTINSVFFDSLDRIDTPESWFTTTSESASFSTTSEDSGGDSLETVIRGVRSERLFFEPGGDTSSILGEVKQEDGGEGYDRNSKKTFPFKESVVLAMESENPYVDFRKSMEEMIESHGLMKDWECLEELLGWYLRVNGKKTHGFIVGAFVDLLLGGDPINCSSSFSKDDDDVDQHEHETTSTVFCSAVSSFSSPPNSVVGDLEEIDEEEKMV
ncbi:Ovate protein family, C-terminal [Dillenia turbinata]|uniref:Transcription repressor n=1 Tax=Dillenia turbinata TaxID=194707 RepID=A0AAN8ZB04_9MAGN